MDCCGIAVNVNHDPKRSASVDACQKDALVLSVDVEHHVATGREVESEQDADVDVAFRQSLAPKSRTACQIYFFSNFKFFYKISFYKIKFKIKHTRAGIFR